jgi:hypothetical protein
MNAKTANKMMCMITMGALQKWQISRSPTTNNAATAMVKDNEGRCDDSKHNNQPCDNKNAAATTTKMTMTMTMTTTTKKTLR